MRLLTLFVAFPLLITLVACLPGQALEDITALEAQEKILADEDVFVLDVRQPEEYAEGYIPGAHLIPLGELEDRLGEIPQDQEILVACALGGRSKVAAQLLSERGLLRVFNVLGGTTAWQRLPAQLHLKVSDLRVQLPNPDILLLDVRTATEYSRGHVPDAISIPADLVRAQPPDVPKNWPIVILAATTDEGDVAAQELLGLGYIRVLVLENGMSAWFGAASVSPREKLLTTWVDLRRIAYH